MARHFVDTSALVKLYRNEPESSAVRSCVLPNDSLLLAGIAVLEFQSAFFSLVRQNLINHNHALERIQLLEADLKNFEVIPLAQALVASAQALLTRFAVVDGLRPADALQLACALETHAALPLDSLLTTDGVLRTCAIASGLVVKP